MNWKQTQSYLYQPVEPVGPKQMNDTYQKSTGFDKSPQAIQRNLTNYLTPVQLSRLKSDLTEWRSAMSEAELAYNPHRVRMQRMFIDTILNGHVFGLMEARKDLTTLRAPEWVKRQGDKLVKSNDLTQQFEDYTWFQMYIEYVLDAIFFGYSLISLGDIIDGNFAEVDIVRRWNVSPDRKQVTNIIYALSGQSWEDNAYSPWHVYVPTPNRNGVGKCGYGLFYNAAIYEIFLRNTLGYNSDFVELYSQPYRVGKTTKTDEGERGELEAAIRNMGSNGWAIIDPLDEITFLETNLGGTGWQGYDNFEQRCQKLVSKIFLGHADGIDSTPGKLGPGQGGEESPVAKALRAKQMKDARFVLPFINTQLKPRLKKFGFKMPDEYFCVFSNDEEKTKQRQRDDENNLKTAQVAQTMNTAGLKMAPEYFEERTGIPTSEVELPDPNQGIDEDVRPDKSKSKIDKATKLKNMMTGLYGK